MALGDLKTWEYSNLMNSLLNNALGALQIPSRFENLKNTISNYMNTLSAGLGGQIGAVGSSLGQLQNQFNVFSGSTGTQLQDLMSKSSLLGGQVTNLGNALSQQSLQQAIMQKEFNRLAKPAPTYSYPVRGGAVKYTNSLL